MERTKLKAAREAKGGEKPLSQQAVADALGCSRGAYNMWERGVSDPQGYWVDRLLSFYDKKDPKDLDISITIQITEGQVAMLQNILGSVHLDRRQALELVSRVPALAVLIDTLAEPQSLGKGDSGSFLKQCNAAVNACWHLLKHDGMVYAGSLLAHCDPMLFNLATRESDYQSLAASLAAQVRILQVILAGHELDFVNREIYCLDAVHFGELSGDENIHAAALGYLGYHNYLYIPRPNKAIAILKDGLACIGRQARLQRSIIYMGMSGAYALNGDEDNAVEMARQAKTTMPSHPEHDPLYTLIDIGTQELYQLEGRMYLILDEKFPHQGYAQKAFDAFSQEAHKQAISDRTESEILICQADAARGIGDLHSFAKYLEWGATIALQINSEKRKHEVCTVLGKVPDEWLKEDKYQQLAKMF